MWHLVVLRERAHEDHSGDLPRQVPLGTLHALPPHIDHAELSFVRLEIHRLDGACGIAHLQDLLVRRRETWSGDLLYLVEKAASAESGTAVGNREGGIESWSLAC